MFLSALLTLWNRYFKPSTNSGSVGIKAISVLYFNETFKAGNSLPLQEISCKIYLYFIYFLNIYLGLPTRAGSPQQHMPITVDPFYLTHPVNFPRGRKPEYPGKTHDFRQSTGFYSFHMRTAFESHWESSHWGLNLQPQEVKGKCTQHLATHLQECLTSNALELKQAILWRV